MTKSPFTFSLYSRYNISDNESDIHVFVREYRERIENYYFKDNAKGGFVSYSNRGLSETDLLWLEDNDKRFLQKTPNKHLNELDYPSEHSFITAMDYSPDGEHIIVGHASGLVQMRHGSSGTVLCTLRNIQYPHKPIYSLQYSCTEERVCYAACADGIVYRIEIPNITTVPESNEYCIRADPALECLHTQFYGTPGILTHATPFITQRSPALSFGIDAEQKNMIVGYADSSVKVFNMETQQAEVIYKVHKLRLQFIPHKLQRMHFNQVCAIRCHDQRPFVFASAAWDKTLRIWDTRCSIGCMMTFEGVDVCGDSIDLNRDHCIAGSWQPTEALTVWDIVARKKLHVVRVQNRRPNIDGEYIYACRYWRSADYNRKGKYAIIGGSGTKCVEVINLHNRYITCSYPAAGTVVAVTSHQDRIAFGGTAPVFSIVTFHDPKHEKYTEDNPDYDYEAGVVTMYDDDT